MLSHTSHIFPRFFVPSVLILLVPLLLYGRSEIEREQHYLRNQEIMNVALGADTLKVRLGTVVGDLRFLAQSQLLSRALQSPDLEGIGKLGADFTAFSQAKQSYHQIRWLDSDGMERVRVDQVEGQALRIPEEQLQDKRGRYYFRDAMALHPGELFISPLDLNVEQGQIETPLRPMIRIATPVATPQGEPRGIVILNLSGRHLLDAFADATANISTHVSLLNREGYWLHAPDPSSAWGFMFGRKEQTLAVQHPEAWQQIDRKEAGQAWLEDGIWTWRTVYPPSESRRPGSQQANLRWKVVAHLDQQHLDALAARVWRKLSAVGALLLLLISYAAWKLTQAWTAREQAERWVHRVNNELEALVTQRTLVLNKKLEQLDQTNAELEAKNKEMEGMIYVASHDLRSPLVNIQGFSQRLAKATERLTSRLAEEDVDESLRASLRTILEERIPTSLGFIKRSSQKMDNLINGLLHLSRAGRAPLNPQPLDLGLMLEEIRATLTTQLHEAEGELHVDTLPGCIGDPTQINQVFTNLIDNAIKYRDPARPLRIEVTGTIVKDERAQYQVTDTGIGIAEESQESVWQLFHQVNPRSDITGDGVGLPLVRRIIERHNGKIWLESKLGEGTRIHLELPLPNEREGGTE